MSKADEMFEKLGYEMEVVNNGVEYYTEIAGEDKEIDFIEDVDTKEKEIWIDDFHVITIQELQAINEKVKELRLGINNK